jgi:hypothetical protein
MQLLRPFQSLTAIVLLGSVVLGTTKPTYVLAAEVINDGTGYHNGKLSDGSGLGWIASGVLKHGCGSGPKIKNCYGMSLTDNPNKMLDTNHLDTPRQRIELPAPHAKNGERYTYTWKYYLSSKTRTGKNFFHNWQILQRPKDASGGPVLTMDAIADKIVIKDDLCPQAKCPSIPLSNYTDRTVLNTMDVTFGPQGRINYQLTDADSGEVLLTYARGGGVGRDEVK